MLSKNINQNIFSTDVEKVPTRKGFGIGLASEGEKNKSIVALCADLTESTQMHLFRDKFPDRFVEIGVAEQNLVTVASGMAALGKLPFVSSYAMFSPGRNWEQIRTTIAYNNRKVVIVGSHAGISVGPDGGTHQAIEDIALMRVIPNMAVISPCDSIEAEKATKVCTTITTPVYLRLAREKTPVLTTIDTPFEFGKGYILWQPEGDKKIDVALVGTGPLLYRALCAARELEKHQINVQVVNIHTIKPIDTELLISVAKNARAVVTVEEHQIAGGLGGTVAEVLSQYAPVPIEFVGILDTFGQSGTQDELIAHYGLDEKAIIEKVKKVIARKLL